MSRNGTMENGVAGGGLGFAGDEEEGGGGGLSQGSQWVDGWCV